MKVRSPYDEPVDVPDLRRVVNPGQVVDVPDETRLPNLLAAGWKPADEAAKKAAASLAKTETPDAGAKTED